MMTFGLILQHVLCFLTVRASSSNSSVLTGLDSVNRKSLVALGSDRRNILRHSQCKLVTPATPLGERLNLRN